MDTGFEHDKVRKVDVLQSDKFLDRGLGVIQLLKLHGSVSWLIEKGTGNIIEATERGQSYVGRRYEGEMMLYPIAEKELYLNPYISMLLRLNWELEKKPVWVVIGYSFNDSVIREIFVRNFSEEKHLIFVHPEANEIYSQNLSEMKGKLSLMKKRFGLIEKDLHEVEKLGEIQEEYNKVNHQIIHKLKDNPRFAWNSLVIP